MNNTHVEISYLSLGSNIDDRLQYLTQAVRKLNAHQNITVTKISAVYETEAWGLKDQDDYYNMAVEIRTKLEPYHLLDVCQNVEQDLDRIRTTRWGPRTIDIDILLYGKLNINDNELMIPHPYMLKREFVVVPLHEIAPKLMVCGSMISDIIKDFRENSTCVKTQHQIDY